MSHANPLQPGWDQGFGKTLLTNLQAPVYLLCGLGTQMHRTKLSAVLTVTEPPYLSWALSIELRKHRDMRLSHCPKWDLAKNVRRSWGAFHTHRKQPKACCGDGRHRCVDTCRSYSLATSSPQPDSPLLLQKQTKTQQLLDPPPGGGSSQTKGRMQVGALFNHLSAFPYSTVSLPYLRLGAQDHGLGCFC